MSQKRTDRILNLLLLCFTAMILFVFAAIASCSGAGISNSAAFAAEEDDEEENSEPYPFSVDSVVCVRNKSCAAVYFVGEVDESLEFRLVAGDGENGEVSKRPYFDGLNGDISVYVVRAADERYAEFLSEALEITEVVDEVIAMPSGQKKVYDGRAAVFGDAVFSDESGDSTEAVEVGKYRAAFGYTKADGEVLEIQASYTIVPAQVTVTPVTVQRKYLKTAGLKGVRVKGDIPEEKIAYISENTTLTVDERLNEQSPVGEYEIYAEYTGNDKNFEVTVQKGRYIVAAADLTGFSFPSLDVKYDGKPHKLTVEYDKSIWTDVSVIYDINEAVDSGKYHCSAVVKKNNYADLTLNATLLIRSEYLESSSMKNYVRLSGNEEGYDPEIEISLVKSSVKGLEETVEPMLKSDSKSREEMVADYDVKLLFNDSETTVDGDAYTLRIRLSGLDSATGVRILQCDGQRAEEMPYTFENGYFILKTDNLEGLVFIKSFRNVQKSPSSIIMAVIVGAVVVLVILAVISALFGGWKSRRRSRRRHSKWA